jgi:hypothetical protein
LPEDPESSEIFISTDVETDGPVPGLFSMLSIGAAAFDDKGAEIGRFSANLEQLPGASTAPATMAWWAEHPDAWAACRATPAPPETAMRAFDAWVREQPGTPVFVAYPAGFDFSFVQWYFHRFLGASPFGHDALDMRSYAMGMFAASYRAAGKSHHPSEWFDPAPLSHVAVEDAVQQGRWFCRMRAANSTKKEHLS